MVVPPPDRFKTNICFYCVLTDACPSLYACQSVWRMDGGIQTFILPLYYTVNMSVISLNVAGTEVYYCLHQGVSLLVK